MKHYLNFAENAIKRNWDLPAFTTYGKNTFTFGQVAEQIEKLHIIFQLLDIQKGDKATLCAKSWESTALTLMRSKKP
jgi:long-chain acyl-CoA synthetase